MSSGFKKFSTIGRAHFSQSLSNIFKGKSSARFSLEYIRPKTRAILFQIASGERIHPEFVRVNLSGCVKAACLRSVVFTIPTKSRGLRIQSSDVILGEPGTGKGLGAQ